MTYGEVAAGVELEADPGRGRARPNVIAHRQKVAAGAEPEASLKKGRAGPNAIAYRQKVAAGAEPKRDPYEGQPQPNAIAHQDPRHTHQRDKPPRHWLEVPANHLEEDKVVAKRKALAEELMGEDAKKYLRIRRLMCPRMRALDHPAAPLPKEYASKGCPVDVGRDWTLEEPEAAVEKAPHSSALEPDATEQIQIEAREKVKQGFAKITRGNS